jgi:hypothetical protein
MVSRNTGSFSDSKPFFGGTIVMQNEYAYVIFPSRRTERFGIRDVPVSPRTWKSLHSTPVQVLRRFVSSFKAALLYPYLVRVREEWERRMIAQYLYLLERS